MTNASVCVSGPVLLRSLVWNGRRIWIPFFCCVLNLYTPWMVRNNRSESLSFAQSATCATCGQCVFNSLFTLEELSDHQNEEPWRERTTAFLSARSSRRTDSLTYWSAGEDSRFTSLRSTSTVSSACQCSDNANSIVSHRSSSLGRSRFVLFLVLNLSLVCVLLLCLFFTQRLKPLFTSLNLVRSFFLLTIWFSLRLSLSCHRAHESDDQCSKIKIPIHG